MTHKLRELDVPRWGKRWVSAEYMPETPVPCEKTKAWIEKTLMEWEEDSDKWYMEELERLRERAPA